MLAPHAIRHLKGRTIMLAWIFLIFMTIGQPAQAHNGYENTPAKDCCGGEHHRMCRAVVAFGSRDGKYWFVVPRDPDDPTSPREVVELPPEKVRAVELFPNSPRADKAHWCGSFESNDGGGYKDNGLCAFIPPPPQVGSASPTILDAALRPRTRAGRLLGLRLHRLALRLLIDLERTANGIKSA